MFHQVPMQLITGITKGAWKTVTLSDYVAVPSTCTGVIVQVVSPADSTISQFAVRKMGSTDSHICYLQWGQTDAIVGVNSSFQFQVYGAGATVPTFYIKGYTSTGVGFFTNGYYKRTGARNAWDDVVCSEVPEGATGIIWHYSLTAGHAFGVRKKGSTDNRITYVNYGGCYSGIVGCDENKTIEQYIEDTSSRSIYVIGYITADITFNTNATNISLGSTGAYADLAALTVGAGMQIIEVVSSGYYNWGIRKKGETIDVYRKGGYHFWKVVAADASGISEAKIENAGVDMFLVGVCNPPSARPFGGVGMGPCMVM